MGKVLSAEEDFAFYLTSSYPHYLVNRKRHAENGTALSLYSQPFYTAKYGYKMCCRIYLNGDGLGE